MYVRSNELNTPTEGYSGGTLAAVDHIKFIIYKRTIIYTYILRISI